MTIEMSTKNAFHSILLITNLSGCESQSLARSIRKLTKVNPVTTLIIT